MTNIYLSGTAAQLPPATTKPIDDFGHAIRNAHSALLIGPLDRAILFLENASRLAAGVKNPHARQLANFANELRGACETVQLVEMYLLDMFPEQ
jgi:hypothetical protein